MGEVFREWYGKVSQLRSLVPTNTPVLALTATSTLTVQMRITKNLGMSACTVVKGPLDRPNIRFSVVKVSRDLKDAFGWLLHDIKIKRTNALLCFVVQSNLCFTVQAVPIPSAREKL